MTGEKIIRGNEALGDVLGEELVLCIFQLDVASLGHMSKADSSGGLQDCRSKSTPSFLATANFPLQGSLQLISSLSL